MERDCGPVPSPGWCDRSVVEAVDMAGRTRRQELLNDLWWKIHQTTFVPLRGTSPPRVRRGACTTRFPTKEFQQTHAEN